MISIIVPVYNAERFLNKCIDSILLQSFRNFELLLIDDGSTDNSGAICDEYARKDSRIRVFHQSNKGVSSARNSGIENASGDWIMFVDADDWIEPDCLEVCSKYFDCDLDLIVFSCIWAADSRVPDMLCNCPSDFQTILPQYIDKIIFVVPWCKFFKKQILDYNKVRFDISLSSAEDTLFSFEYLKYVKKLQLISNELYHHTISDNINSLSRKRNSNWQIEEYLLRKIFDTVNELEGIFEVKLTKFRCLMGESRLNRYLPTFSESSYLVARRRLKEVITNKELQYLFNDKVFMPKGERRQICDWLIKKHFVSLLTFYFKYVRAEY